MNSNLVLEGLLKIDFGKVFDEKIREFYRGEM